MALGRVVDTSVRLLIARVYQEHPDWRAKEVKAEVNKRLGKDWPGLSVVQKELSKIRGRREVDDPQDKPWSTATLNDYPIPPEALPAVLKVWKSRYYEKGLSFPSWDGCSAPFPLTIRQAKWVSRLSAVRQDIDGLSFIARRHALSEQLSEFIGSPFDSQLLDMLIMGLPEVVEWVGRDKNTFRYHFAYMDEGKSQEHLAYMDEGKSQEHLNELIPGKGGTP